MRLKSKFEGACLLIYQGIHLSVACVTVLDSTWASLQSAQANLLSEWQDTVFVGASKLIKQVFLQSVLTNHLVWSYLGYLPYFWTWPECATCGLKICFKIIWRKTQYILPCLLSFRSKCYLLHIYTIVYLNILFYFLLLIGA